MKEFFDWLSSNSTGSIIFITSFSILFLTILLIYLISFFQGREISFYPPKIGSKPEKQETSRGEKKGRNQVPTTNITLSDRSGLDKPLEIRLEKAKTVCLMGKNLVGLISQYEGLIETKTKAGCDFRILMTSPKFYEKFKSSSTSLQGGPQRKIDLEHSISKIQHILKHTKNLRLRVLDFPPTYSLLILDGEQSHGEIQVEMYTFEKSQSSRPHFVLTRNIDTQWYEFFRNEFELAWQDSAALEIEN